MNRAWIVALALAVGVGGLVVWFAVRAPAEHEAAGVPQPEPPSTVATEAPGTPTEVDPPTSPDDGELDPAAPSPETRATRAEIEALGRDARHTPEIEARLVEALTFPDQDVRGHAAWGLGRMAPASHGSVPALIVALGDRVWSVQHNAAWALVRFDPAHVEGPLLAALDDPSTTRRVRAAKTLLEVAPSHGERAEAALLDAWRDASDDMRIIAALAMGQLQRPSDRVIAHLGAIMHEPGRVELLESAIGSLGALGAAARGAASDLVVAMGHQDAGIRRSAAIALGRLGPAEPAVVAALVRTLDDRKEGPAVAAAQALARLGAIDALDAALQEGSVRARTHAITGLGATEEPLDARRVGLFTRALADPEWPVRLAAASALASRDAEAAVEALAAALDDEHEAVRAQARAALTRMDLPAAKAALDKARER